jgi:membrane peptidoglycan carboxypeptidase
MFGSAAIQQGGIVVHTTLDLGLQQIAQSAVTNGVQDLSSMNVNNSALLAADPKTGEVLAWVGSADYGNDSIAGQYDVVLAERQPGSSFKPYVYEAALRDRKITWATVLHDTPTNFSGYTPHDFDNGGMGDVTARTAILNSRNIPAVEVGQIEGMQNVITLAHQMGIQSKLDPGLSTAIGGSDVTLFEHVQGYQTFGNQGQRVDLSVIREVDRTGGHAIYTHNTPNPTAVLTPAEAFLMSDVLKNYQNQWHFGWNRQMASKTGTSDNGTGGLIRAYGENVGLTTMKRFVNALPSNMRDWYSQPPGIVRGCGSDTQDPFLEGVCQVSPKPSSSTSPTRTPSAGPTSSPNPTPVLSPSPSTAPSPTPAAPASPKPTPT